VTALASPQRRDSRSAELVLCARAVPDAVLPKQRPRAAARGGPLAFSAPSPSERRCAPGLGPGPLELAACDAPLQDQPAHANAHIHTHTRPRTCAAWQFLLAMSVLGIGLSGNRRKRELA
jgi:hypothetical protein